VGYERYKFVTSAGRANGERLASGRFGEEVTFVAHL